MSDVKDVEKFGCHIMIRRDAIGIISISNIESALVPWWDTMLAKHHGQRIGDWSFQWFPQRWVNDCYQDEATDEWRPGFSPHGATDDNADAWEVRGWCKAWRP